MPNWTREEVILLLIDIVLAVVWVAAGAAAVAMRTAA